MKKLIVELDTDNKEDLYRFAEQFNSEKENEMLFILNRGIKIFLLDGFELKQIYPAIEREKFKLGELEIDRPYVPGGLMKSIPKVKNNFWKNLFKKKKEEKVEDFGKYYGDASYRPEMDPNIKDITREDQTTGNTEFTHASELIAENPPEPEILKKPKKKKKSKRQQKTKSRIGVAEKSSYLANP